MAMDVPQRGSMLIAQLDYSIGIADALHMRVAAITVNSTVVERPEYEGLWSDVVNRLIDTSVRVVVFKDSAKHFRNALGQTVGHTQISNMCGSGPSFFLLGPVASLWCKDQGEHENIVEVHPPGDNEDMAAKWATFGILKLKVSHTNIEKTMSTYVFCGSEKSRRSPAKVLERKLLAQRKWKGGKKGR